MNALFISLIRLKKIRRINWNSCLKIINRTIKSEVKEEEEEERNQRDKRNADITRQSL